MLPRPRTAPRLCVALTLLVGACCSAPMATAPAPGAPRVAPPDLPDAVHFRTRTETFNQRWALALRDDRIWFKPHTERTGVTGPWRLLGRTGRPEGCGLEHTDPPAHLVAISADGAHLTALSSDGVFYRATDLRNAADAGFGWTDAWGWFAATGPGLRWELGDLGAAPPRFDVADSHPFDVARYQDGSGTTHPVGFGVAHVYALGPEGRRIYYNDWWLPADWSRQICGPRRGTFEAVALSASASTLFVVDAAGELFTTLQDFDVSGENPLYTYSYVAPGDPGAVRRLPMPGWRRQPAVPEGGEITARITIFQDGEGNAARVLRVEGRRDGATGYFEKRLEDDAWTFHPTGASLSGPPLVGPHPAETVVRANPEERRLVGTLTRDGVAEPLTVELVDLHPVCSPARMRILRDGAPVTAGGRPWEVPFHHVHTLVTRVRPAAPWDHGVPAAIRAAIVVPEDLDRIDDPGARAHIRAHLGDIRTVHLEGKLGRGFVDARELTVWDLFRAPADEKGGTSRFRLAVADPAAPPTRAERAAPVDEPLPAVGVGLLLGEPIGLTVKAWPGERHALALGVAWDFSDVGLAVTLDYLLHLGPHPRELRIAPYLGIGGKAALPADDLGDVRWGVRLPLGVHAHLWVMDFFVEVAPGLRVTPALGFDLDAGVGLRFYP